jgi:hypothetical protein
VRAAGTRIRSADDTGSLALALLLTLVGVSMTGLLASMVITQIGSTRVDVQRVHAINAAQGGLDVALGHIRAADDGAGNGLLSSLPCGPLTGRVGAGGTARYEVTISYVAVDSVGTRRPVVCIPSGGAYSTPTHALLLSKGTDQPTGSFDAVATRTLSATYTFHTKNQNIAGGLIHAFKTSTVDLCLDAGSSAPAAGTSVQMQPCGPGSTQQKFAYQTNLTLVLVAAQTPATPLGMCLDAGAPHATGAVVRFQPCAATTRPQQQWSINDSANFQGTADGKSLDAYCFTVQNPNWPGSVVVLGGCGGAYNSTNTFSPDASVGAGAAGPAAGQLVNFHQFGRCLDVTGQDVNAVYLIVWPCKQAPDATQVTWNQRWALPALADKATSATGQITTRPSATYCLQSPGGAAGGQYVKVVPCVSGYSPPSQTWTVYADTGSYPTSYQIRDGFGYCLSPTDPNAKPADLYPQGEQISKIVVAACSGSTLQKWNAPPGTSQSQPLKDISEK